MSDSRGSEVLTDQETATPSAANIEKLAEELRDRALSELVMDLRKTTLPPEQWDTVVGFVWEEEYIQALKTHLEAFAQNDDGTANDWKITMRYRVDPVSADNAESGNFYAGQVYNCERTTEPTTREGVGQRTRIFKLGFVRDGTTFSFANELMEEEIASPPLA